MSDPKGNKASSVPSSGSNLHEMDPGAQASMLDTEGSLPQATSVAQSRPRSAAAAASSIQHSGVPRRNREATRTTSRKANEANDMDPNVTLYCADRVRVWEPRPLPKILLDLMKPVPKPPLANSETKAVPVQATTVKRNINRVTSYAQIVTAELTQHYFACLPPSIMIVAVMREGVMQPVMPS
jgi:hypothetical protein